MKMIGFLARSLALVLFVSAIGLAQETTGGIEVTIKDANGAVVPNVSATIVSSGQTALGSTGIGAGFRRTVTTNEEGFFRATQIPPGVYEIITTPTSGFSAAKYENITVTIGKNTQLEITVTPGTTTTTVDVAASDAAPVDTTNSAIQTSISVQKMELLPKGTGFTSVLKTVPGTRPESRTAGFSVDGASGGENVFTLDGQEVTNYRTGTLNETFNIPTQLVQEVQIKSSGFTAEYGGATGGVISAVTRGGSNDFHGQGQLQFEVPKFNGNPRQVLAGAAASSNFTTTPTYYQPAKAGGTNVFPTASLGGRIIKDRMWFFGSYSPQIYQTDVDTKYLNNTGSALVTTQRFSRTTTYEYGFARIDANPLSKLRLTGTFLWNPVKQEGSLPSTSFSNVSTSAFVFNSAGLRFSNYGGSIGSLDESQYRPRQGGRQTSNAVTFAGVYTPTSNLVIDGRYSRGFLNEKLGNYFVPQFVEVVSPCNFETGVPTSTFPCTPTGSSSQTAKDVSIRETYEFSGSYLFTLGGRHELKGGYQRYAIFNDVQSGNNLYGSITYQIGPTKLINTLDGRIVPTPGSIGSATLRRTGTHGSGSNLSQGIFIQDKWQPTSRLTLNLGVRFEAEDLPTFNGIPSGVDFGWFDKIAPRLGFAYDIFGDGTTKAFASYGKFYDRLKFALPRGLFGGDIFLEDYFELFPGENGAQFNLGNVVNGYTGPSPCPTTGFIAPGARSRCQKNLRVNANEVGASPYLNGAVDPNLKPFQQTEFTVGAERQISRDYVLRLRYTYKNVDEAVEDAGIVNAAGNEAYIIGNPGSGLHLETLTALGYLRSTRPKRRYDGFEAVLDKRLSNNWYFNANYTFSRLHGNYTGLASSDEAHLVDGRTSPGVTRAFDLPFIGFTAEGQTDNGPLPTDRPHVFNIYGAYIFDWMGSKTNSTELSAFQTVASGTPMTTSIYGQSSVTPQIFYHRGDLGRSPTFTQTDFNVTHRYKFGRDDRFTMAFDLNFLNLWDQATVTGIYPTMNTSSSRPSASGIALSGGTALSDRDYANGYTSGSLLPRLLNHIATLANQKEARYKLPQLYQSPRVVRFGFRMMF